MQSCTNAHTSCQQNGLQNAAMQSISCWPFVALDGGSCPMRAMLGLPIEKTDLRKSNHRRYSAEKFCKHGRVEQILRLYSVLPEYDRIHPAPGGGQGFGYFHGEFYDTLSCRILIRV